MLEPEEDGGAAAGHGLAGGQGVRPAAGRLRAHWDRSPGPPPLLLPSFPVTEEL